jgi:hypothetical protein
MHTNPFATEAAQYAHLTDIRCRSGAEGSRTPDLRRAKSGPYCRGSSPLFKNACKIALLSLAAFASVRCYSCGLVCYWCKRAVTNNPLGVVCKQVR